jgi:hypothetical protein
MKAPAAKKQDAPAVAKIKAKKLVPAKKAAKGSKSGRVVGISADENKFLYKLLTTLDADSLYSDMIKENQDAFNKLLARYNKN